VLTRKHQKWQNKATEGRTPMKASQLKPKTAMVVKDLEWRCACWML
jgi:hypothetical protein